jgi:DNA primase
VSRIAQSSIQEVLNRLDALAVVEEYTRLEKRGGRYWGRCPFHAGGQEKTPSFTVDPEQKLYYCFGCRKGGGIIDFVMEMDKASYPDTIKTLARRFGVELVYEGGSAVHGGEENNEDWEAEKSRKEQLYELYRRTAVSFSHFLLEKPEGKAALDYLVSRGISREMIGHFRLGHSPADRNWLYRFLQGKGYSAEFLDGSALFSANHRGMAFFSNRLMFPIADRQGRIVAFGGRAMPGAVQSDGREPPKYLNTREIEIYKKGQILYALDLALPEIRRTKTVYIAEGYMDVIALHQAGITNAVAPCGTAFTDEQARLLRHWADNVVLVFDSDEAGQKAAMGGIITCRKNGFTCSMVVPGANGEELKDPAGPKDPADILSKFGAETLNKSMKCVIIDFGYLVARGKSLYDITLPQGKAQALAVLYPYFNALESKTERDDCIGAVSEEMRIDRAAVLAEYERWQRTATHKPNLEEVSPTEPEINRNFERLLLTVVAVNTRLFPEFRAAVEMREIEDTVAKEIYLALEESLREGEGDTDAVLSRISSPALRNFIIEQGMSPEFKGDEKRDPRKFMEDGISRMKEKRFRRRQDEIGAELRRLERMSGAEAEGDLQELIAEKMYIDAEIRKLEGKTG